jgi:hypothetical protein
MTFYRGRTLGEALMHEGVIPANAYNVELHITTNNALFLRYEVLVSDDDLRKVHRAIATMLEVEDAIAAAHHGDD